jgi:hypothetical protein
MHGTTHVLPRSAAMVTLFAALALTGCSGPGQEVDPGPTYAEASRSRAGEPAEPSPDVQVGLANSALVSESFHSSGTSTAFPGAKQEMWWEPAGGLRLRVTGSVSGDMYCDGGTSYTSAPLFAASLTSRGQSVTVPGRLEDTYVSTVLDTGCEVFFSIPATAKPAPDKDRSIDGRKSLAYEASGGGTQDVYYLPDLSSAPTGEVRLGPLRLESTRSGRTSVTTYDYGTSFSITMPPDSKVMTVEEFRAAVQG